MSGAQLLRKPRHRTPSALLRAGFIGWLLTWSMVLSGHAAAEEHWERNRRFYATVYGDTGPTPICIRCRWKPQNEMFARPRPISSALASAMR
jgi:hypothetical protein